jgi:hypothetical protein
MSFRLERSGSPPQGAIPCGHQNDGAGTLWAAVAHSGHGNIPGKAQNGTCWYPYGGQEHSTRDFSWVVASSWRTRRDSRPPAGALRTGHQNDGAGDLWAAVAHTGHGDIPGKARNGTCWYPYGGKEHTTNDFSWVCTAFELVRNAGGPPHGAVDCGHQNDGAGTLWAAVAHTNHGDIPGKAQNNTCWYPYGGKEHTTNDFSWVVAPGWRLERSRSTPQHALPVGHQNDGAGSLWAAVAHTHHGKIPGKAQNGTCWYPYGGQEHTTNDFSWVVV